MSVGCAGRRRLCRRSIRGLPRLAPVILAALALPFPQPVVAQESALPLEYQVKAAFLFNFAKFVEWPSDNPFFFQAEDGIRVRDVTGVQTCALPISGRRRPKPPGRSRRP